MIEFITVYGVMIAIIGTLICYRFFLKRNDKMYKIVMEVYPDIMVITKAKDGTIVDINEAGCKLAGYRKEEMIGQKTTQTGLGAWVNEKDREKYITTLMRDKYAPPMPVIMKNKEGNHIHAEISGRLVVIDNEAYTIGSIRDVTDRVNVAEKIERLAFYDELTGLANRAKFKSFIENRLTDYNKSFALLFVDLDNFKLVNDSRGHYFGDLLLKDTADFLTSFVKNHELSKDKETLITRIGGDEFTIIIFDITPESIRVFAGDLMKRFIVPRFIDDIRIVCSMSIGISMFPESGKTLISLMKTADMALYNSKERGKNQYSFYNTIMILHLEKFNFYTLIAQDIIEKNDLGVVFQPIYSFVMNDIHAAEALIRLPEAYANNGKLNIELNIEDFITVIEETGQIIPVTFVAIDCIIREAKEIWKEHPDFKISINLSSRFFNEDIALVDQVFDRLIAIDVITANIHFELTETVLTRNFTRVKSFIERASLLGIKIDIDDFGKGFSSMELISQLPILSKMKIDKSFINNIKTNERAYHVLKSMIILGQNLGMHVCVEGVENKEQVDILKVMKVEYIQGFFNGLKPVSSKTLLNTINKIKLVKI